MKMAIPKREELGRWLTGGGVVWAGALMKFLHDPDFWPLALVTGGGVLAIVLLYLTIRANVYAVIRRHQRSEIAGE